jgi:CRP-like cAMP-binding protein
MPGINSLVRKLATIGTLTELEKTAICKIQIVEREYAANEMIVLQGERPDFSVLVLGGTIFRHKISRDRRQILSFHISGDMPDLHALFVDVVDHGLTAAAGPVRIAKIPHLTLAPFLRLNPRISELLWRETFIDASIFGEWIVNVGRRNALERTAHLLCECMTRATAMNLVKDGVCPLPVTQIHLSDATGLSAVHLNRSLQTLRKMALIEFKDGQLKILDWKAMMRLAEFDEQYLHIKHDPDATKHHTRLN